MSTNTDEQNGRQASLRNHNTPPSDPRIENLSEHQKPVCRKYVWGICDKSSHCKFRHELVYDEMKKILKFCHDYQNKQGCTRIDCSYLHATSEEQNLFLTAGQIPRVLLERYKLATCEPTNMPNFEGMPQMGMFGRAPPPPPPPPAPIMAGSTLPPPPPPPPQPQPQSLLSFTPIQQPPPPPPPPPTTTQQSHVFSTIRAQPQQTPVNFPMSQPPPPVPPVFDASRPPPPLPKNIGKRKLELIETSSSKMQRVEQSKLGDSVCEHCVQREIRINLVKQQMEKVQAEEEYHSLIFKKKFEDFESGKNLLRSLISPELYRILNEYIEGGPPDILSQCQNYFISGTSTVPKQFLLQLMEYVFKGPRSAVVDASISASRFSQRSDNASNSSSTEILQSVLEVIRNNTTNSSDSLSIEGNQSTSPGNGIPINNGPQNDRASGSGLNTNRYLNAAEIPTQSYQSAAGPSSSHAAPACAYPMYQPGVPPPLSRPPSYYPLQYGSNSSTAIQGSVRPAPSPLTSNRPLAPSIHQYNAPGKYPPGPQFYHSFH